MSGRGDVEVKAPGGRAAEDTLGPSRPDPAGSTIHPPPVAAFVPSTMVDWDDRIASVVVLQGCSFRCPCCHSAGFVPAGLPANVVPWGAVERHFSANAGWIDGVVVSGGEPTVHAGLAALLEKLRDLELPVKLDTNGSSPGRLRGLVEAGLVRHVAMDVKAPLEVDSYARATGLGPGRAAKALDSVRESLDYLRTKPVSCELRTTVAPNVFTDVAHLEALAIELSWAARWYLQAFRPLDCLDPRMTGYPPTDPAWLGRTAARLREVAPDCRVRGEG
jgi:pyruvate formate lyase activating enzyme